MGGEVADSETADPRMDALQGGAREWRLLCQIASDDGSGFAWGDEGNLYFWIPAAALKARSFDATWMVLQCS
jgi:uncharacterized protein YwqG